MVVFLFGVVPSILHKAIIVPVPKRSNKDPNVPLNYRGISLHHIFRPHQPNMEPVPCGVILTL